MHLAGMQADPETDRRKHRELQPQRKRGGIAGTGEGNNEAVTLTLFHRAHAVVGGHQLRHRLV
ncbi:hypothetical protein A5709_14325 [Mycobacterium sp. E1386]|nr:hypothetical protein A5709_14325 [Mycobacterium sp. E1386]